MNSNIYPKMKNLESDEIIEDSTISKINIPIKLFNKLTEQIEPISMIDQIKEFRVQIDGIAQLTKELKPFRNNKTINVVDFIKLEYFNYNSKEIEKTVDSLFFGKAWLGKLLGELGTTNPYGSGYKTKEDIVPTQDVSKVELKFPLVELPSIYEKDTNTFIPQEPREMNHIERVDWLRTEIEKLVKEVRAIKALFDISEEVAVCGFLAKNNCYTHLCEAKMWLGFELERVREEA